MTTTLRLTVPDWQAGNKTAYYLGAQLLSWLAPKNADQQSVTLPIAKPTNHPLTKVNGVTAQPAVRDNVLLAQRTLNKIQPDKVITFGGNYLVSQAPFDYLHQRQPRLGVLWIDAHPDISTPKIYPNEHAMVLGNLLGKGDPALAQLVQALFQPADILYVGLQPPTAAERPLLADLGIQAAHPDAAAIQAWITRHHFSQLAVHLDLDVLDPRWFRSLYFTEPGVTTFPSASGQLSPASVGQLLKQLSAQNDIAGLTIAEYLPWDAVTLQHLMGKLDIFGTES